MAEDFLEIRADKWTFRVPKNRLYNENDCWVRIDGNMAVVGITDFLQNMVGDVIYVDLPTLGISVGQFDEVGSFESVKTVLDLLSPVSGVIKEVNGELRLRPELVNQDPYGKGWFVKIEAKDLSVDRENLLSPEAYFEVMKRKIETEKQKLKK